MGLLNRRSAQTGRGLKVEKEITIVNRLGLHARPAAMFVRIASRFRCEIWVEKEGEQINGKSIMGLMMLAAGQGSKLQIRCEGPDADKAMEELEELIIKKLNDEQNGGTTSVPSCVLADATGLFPPPRLASALR